MGTLQLEMVRAEGGVIGVFTTVKAVSANNSPYSALPPAATLLSDTHASCRWHFWPHRWTSPPSAFISCGSVYSYNAGFAAIQSGANETRYAIKIRADYPGIYWPSTEFDCELTKFGAEPF